MVLVAETHELSPELVCRACPWFWLPLPIDPCSVPTCSSHPLWSCCSSHPHLFDPVCSSPSVFPICSSHATHLLLALMHNVGGADAGRAAAPTCHPNMHKSKRTKSTTQTQNNELSKMRPTRDLSLPLHVSSADPSRSGLNPSRYAPPLSSSSSSKANRLLDMRAGAHTRRNRGRVLQRAPVGGGVWGGCVGVSSAGYGVRALGRGRGRRSVGRFSRGRCLGVRLCGLRRAMGCAVMAWDRVRPPGQCRRSARVDVSSHVSVP